MSLQLRAGALLGATGVVAGAYGSHMLEAHWQRDGIVLDDADILRWKDVWRTAQAVHYLGAASMLALAPAAKLNLLRLPRASSLTLACGTALFTAGCYSAAFFADRKYAVAAPFGGAALIAAFTSLLL
mmetsp:Transcript_3478/g.9517  ORF Transcript_3478/g.9517 Transcript_3478/m.9517 type:complete len:128 (-) Transcript_3478:232-615(-)